MIRIVLCLISIMLFLSGGCDNKELTRAQKDNQDLKTKLNTLTEQSEIRTTQLADQIEKATQLKSTLDQKVAELATVTDNASKAQTSLNAQIKTLNDKNLKFQNDLTTLTTERNNSDALHKTALNTITEKQKIIDKLTADLTASKNQVTTLSTQLAESENTLKATRTGLKNEQANGQKLLADANTLKGQLEKTTQAHTLLDKTYQSELAQSKILAEKLNAAQAQIKTLTKPVIPVIPDKPEPNSRAAARKMQEKINTLETDLKTYQTIITKTKKDLAIFKEKYLQTSEYLKKLAAENERLKKKIASLEW
ncbi:MAG: hypothetical protein K9M57_00440 [Phycisphaerae bacterium]|nr:hypothetical protein [Phycisphaerae bacterium]